MSYLVVLNLGIGDLQNGCAAVTAQVSQRDTVAYPIQYVGSLPPAPELAQIYRRWQLLYREFYRQHSGMSGDAKTRAITIASSGVTHFSEVEFGDLVQQMRRRLNQWLNAESFHSIDRKLSRLFDPTDAIQVIIQTQDPILRRLPWHLWNFFDDFPEAEVGLSVAEYERIPEPAPATGPIRILAVLGNSDQIDVQQDRRVVEALPHTVSRFLIEPSSAMLHEALWDAQGWDILFFAGHSQTEAQSDGETGRLYLNATETLTLEQLRYGLKRAIRQGLKLAIFNSCDGLGLAQALADLHIPQVIVMREVVPDRAAQLFFREFLSQFAAGQNLYAAVRNAREKLEQLETQYPCVTWLPIICQNPAEDEITWRSPAAAEVAPVRAAGHNRRWLLFSLLVMLGITGLRALGSLQTLELQALDQLMRWRAAEPPDPRLLLVTITEQDVQQQNPEQRRGASLSDQALAQLLSKLRPHQPRVIGLDLYRDFAIDPASALMAQLQQTPQLVAVCEVGEQGGTSPLQTIPADRLSFSDLPIDADGVVRRQLLGMATAPTSRCVTDTAFSLRLAQLYLHSQGIQSSRNADGTLQIGQVRFPKLHPDSGGYHQLDALGYQIMLNYRTADAPATQVTLGDVLSGSLDAQLTDLVRDRMVLIGTVAPSFKDDFFTPYSQSDPMQKMSGVLIQAQMTSQLLSAVLDQRPLLRSLPGWGETVWIWAWGLLSSGLVLVCRSVVSLGWAGIGVTAVLVGISYGCLLQGIWLPLVPTTLFVVISSSSAVVYTAWIKARSK